MNAVVVHVYTNEVEAELAKNLLSEEKMWSMVRKELGSLYIGGFPGAALVVKPEDLDKAREILTIS